MLWQGVEGMALEILWTSPQTTTPPLFIFIVPEGKVLAFYEACVNKYEDHGMHSYFWKTKYPMTGLLGSIDQVSATGMHKHCNYECTILATFHGMHEGKNHRRNYWEYEANFGRSKGACGFLEKEQGSNHPPYRSLICHLVACNSWWGRYQDKGCHFQLSRRCDVDV